MKSNQHHSPCAECPFSRAVKTGGTGGTDPRVYVGQACGPFLLPCHMDPRYSENKRSTDLLQCVGAAVFRSNIGVHNFIGLPDFLLREPIDVEKVFATPAELLAHHMGISLEEAQALMEKTPPLVLLDAVLSMPGVQKTPAPEGS
jgi:hypothetical protein